jgi:RNA polymerase sigma factor for flagellar operon FliA
MNDALAKTKKAASHTMNDTLIRKYKSNSKKKVSVNNKKKIIEEYAPLVKFIAQKIAVRLPANVELDDLLSAGVIGLMDAIDKYDPARDNKFKTYAEFRIRGAILDELRSQDWIPRSMREKAKHLERAIHRIEQRKGRTASEEEIAQEVKMDLNEFRALLNQCKSISLISLDDTGHFANGERKSLLAVLESGPESNPLDRLTHQEIKDQLAKFIDELPEKQRLVLSLYYFEELNLKEIGQVLEVTESRVSQLHTQAVLRLRAKLMGSGILAKVRSPRPANC